MKNISWILAPTLAGGLLVIALGCREDAESPTAPESAPALATTATTALAFYQVSAGVSQTCGVTTDSQLYCWGGSGSLTPVAVAGGLSFRQVSAGYGHTCGVTTGYRAYCWGNNGFGQLGDGTTTNRLTPVPVAGGHQFRRVEMNFGFHTCGVSYPDNRAYCWGSNAEGQLGDGTTTQRLTPVPVAGTLRFRQVGAGGFHTCGVTTDDRAFCWGFNHYGQLGDSTTMARRLRPVLVVGGHHFRQVGAGRYHTCAVTTTDRAFCWGNGRQGQMGNGKASTSFWPRAVAGGLYFDRVSPGGLHTCGETTSNRVYCWGSNTEGQLGDGTFTQRLKPVPVAGGLTFGQVSAGFYHTCGKTPAAVAYCWGSNWAGQLGDGTTTHRLTPVAVLGP
jgi:alpha-tubulin suppressor-like RCC1 family protein